MKTEIIEVSPTKKEIKIEIEAEVIKPVFQKTVQKFAKFAQIPGFRKGNAPLDVIKMRYRDDIQNEVLREVLPDKVTEAIREYNLNPIGEPELHLDDMQNLKVNGTEPISLHVHVEVLPEIAEVNYVNLEATRRSRPVKDEEIENIINERRKLSAAFVPVENQKAKKGHSVIIDLQGTFIDDSIDEPFELQDLEIEIGGANTLEVFSENLLGVKEDATKTFVYEYPADFSTAELAGKKVEYTATVKAVGKVEMPEADDEWAKQLGEGFETIAEVRRKLREDMELMSKMESDNRLRDELLKKLTSAHPIEVPSRLVDMQARTLLNNFLHDLEGRGMNPQNVNDQFLQMAFQSMKVQAEDDVRGALLLDKIAQLEKIEVNQEEIDEEIQHMANHFQVSVEEVQKSLENQNGRINTIERIKNRKAVQVLVDKAKVSDGEWLDEAALAAQATQTETAETEEKAEKAEKPKRKSKKAEK